MIAAAPPEGLTPAAPSDPFRASVISSACAVNESNAALPAPLDIPSPLGQAGRTGTRSAWCRTTPTRDEFSLDLGAQAFHQALLGHGVPADRIHFELFDAVHAALDHRCPLSLT